MTTLAALLDRDQAEALAALAAELVTDLTPPAPATPATCPECSRPLPPPPVLFLAPAMIKEIPSR